MTAHDATAISSHAETQNLFLEAALLCSLVLVVLSVGGVMKRRKFHYFGETALCMMTGLAIGLIFMTFTHSDFNESILDKDIQLSADFFYMVLLPPIIFEAGFTLQRMTFFKNLVLILSLAFVGGFYSCMVTSSMMWIFAKFTTFNLTMVESLVFGSLISSTDPVTILAMLPTSVDKRLYMLIFGESALNDAVAIILYRFFTSLADPDMDLGITPFLISALSSIGVFWGSFAVGVAIALAFALLTKYVQMPDGSVYELATLLIFAYMSYIAAELCSLTGIISVFFCGVAMSHYSYNNLSEVTILSAKMCLRTISAICEAFIFLYLGLGLVAFGPARTTYNPIFILGALIAILVARSHIFLILGANNILNPKNHIPMKHMIFMWFGGLRGAVAFALAVQFLDNEFFSAHTRSLLFGTTLIIVFITVAGLGGLTPFLLKKLGMDGHTTEWQEVDAGDDQPVAASAGTGLDVEKNQKKKEEGDFGEYIEEKQDLQGAEDMKPAFAWIHNFDQKFMRPIFSMPESARARRLGLRVQDDEAEQAEDAIATANLPGALAGIIKQTSLKDITTISRFESEASLGRRESSRSVQSNTKKASARTGAASGKDKDDGFEEIQMTVVTKEGE